MGRTKGKRFAEKPSQIRKREKQLAKKQAIDQKMQEKRAKQFENFQKPKKKNKLIYNVIIFICLVTIAFSSYKIINWAIENKKNGSIKTELISSAHVTQQEVIVNDIPLQKASYDFTDLLKRNPQTVGWIYVPNSNIDYPVVQTTDNDFYLNHSFDKSVNSAGWVFAEHSCNPQDSQNVIIYAHNRKDRSMFGSLKNVFEDDWNANLDNHYITFADLNETGIYQIFSAFVCNDSDVNSYLSTDFSTNDNFRAYLEKIKKSSLQNYNVDLSNTEKIITLYTCYGMNNQRLLVFAAKVY